jgi:hypothetical protein
MVARPLCSIEVVAQPCLSSVGGGDEATSSLSLFYFILFLYFEVTSYIHLKFEHMFSQNIPRKIFIVLCFEKCYLF